MRDEYHSDCKVAKKSYVATLCVVMTSIVLLISFWNGKETFYVSHYLLVPAKMPNSWQALKLRM